MAQKQPLAINFAQGLDTKTDPKQVSAGKFLSLQNTVFNNGGLLQKRNGFQKLSSPTYVTNAGYITTYNGNLVHLNHGVNAYSLSTNTWTTSPSSIYPSSLSSVSLVKNNVNQVQVDTAISPNGLVCTAYTENIVVSGSSVNSYKFCISDASTGQLLVTNQTITPSAGVIFQSPRVFYFSNYFCIVYVANNAGTYNLEYVIVSALNPNSISPAATIYSGITPNTTPSSAWPNLINLNWDCTVMNNNLYISFFRSSALVCAYVLNSNLTVSAGPQFASSACTLMSCCSDSIQTNNYFWINWYDGTNLNTVLLDNNLNIIFAPVQNAISPISNLTSIDSSGSVRVFLEFINSYGYDSSIQSNYISNIIINNTGTTSGLNPLQRGVGIASRPFYGVTNYNSDIYILTSYQSPYQSTYFLVCGTQLSYDNLPVVTKLAYSNGGGYLTGGIPSVNSYNNSYYIPYLIKDSITSVSKNTNVSIGNQVAGIYSQTGINLANITLGTTYYSMETAKSLIMTGGFMGMYDGNKVVEQNFFLWPDSVETVPQVSGGGLSPQKYYYQALYEWTDNQGNIHRSAPSIPTVADFTNATNLVQLTCTYVPGTTLTVTTGTINKLIVGMAISATLYIPVNTFIVSINYTNSTLVMSNAATGTQFGVTVSFNIPQVYFTATFLANANQITVLTGLSSLQVGMGISDVLTLNLIPPNTYITAINTAMSVITLNNYTLGYSASDVIYLTGVISNVINVPTLRLTYKNTNPVKILIYRWSTNQQAYYQVTSVQAPILNSFTTDYISFTDTLSDYQILGNSLIYTTGGVVEDINAPATNIMTLWNNRLFSVDAEDPNLIWFSKQVIDATPLEMSDLLTIYVSPTIGSSGPTGNITALSSLDSNLIVFKKDAIYYITGTGPDNTGSNNLFSDPIFITSVVGCANQQSIAFVPQGLVFQSDKGIWLLERNLSTNYIGAPVEKYVLGNTVTSVVSPPGTNQVRFMMSNGISLVYDYFYGQWSTFVGIPGLSSTIYGNLHTFMDKYAGIYQENPGSYLDGSNPVLIQLSTGWINIAGFMGFQRIYEINLSANYFSPHKLAVGLAYDFNPISQVAIAKPNNFTGSYGSDSLYGQTVPYGGPGSNEPWRIFTQTQKCSTFQINIQESYDASYGVSAGAGFSLSGIDCVVGVKKGWRPYSSTNTAS